MESNSLKACCGFGHRKVFENITEQLEKCVLYAVDQGCTIFYTGAMGEFDSLFSTTVREIKKTFPKIKLICVKPYMTSDININGEYLYSLYDDIIIPTVFADVHYKAAIKKRNEFIIEKSDIVIVYTLRKYGGAYQAKKYAEKQNKQLLYLTK